MATTSLSNYAWDQWTGTTSGTSSNINYLYSSAVWDSWTTTGYTYSGTASSTASDQVWFTWNDGAQYYQQPLNQQQAYQEYRDQAWKYWNQRYAIPAAPYTPVKLTTEEFARQQEAAAAQEQEMIRMAERRERKWREAEKRRKKAEATAKDMLLDIIGEKERSIYEQTGQVYVQGRRHGYIIKKWGHVKRIEGNGEIREFCVHLAEKFKYPDTDNVIALLMALKYDEETLIKTANNKGKYPISRYSESELRAACMPKDALKTKVELKRPAITLGEGIAA